MSHAQQHNALPLLRGLKILVSHYYKWFLSQGRFPVSRLTVQRYGSICSSCKRPTPSRPAIQVATFQRRHDHIPVRITRYAVLVRRISFSHWSLPIHHAGFATHA